MDLDILWKAIVPLSFLAIWALTHLVNREAKPLPMRIQPQNPYGPRPAPAQPQNPYAPRPAPPQLPPRPTASSPPPIRWAPQGAVKPPPPLPRAGGDDDIVILDSPRPGRAAGNRGVAPGRRARPKAPKPSQAAAAKPENPQGLLGVSQSVNQQITAPLSIQPLSVTSTAMPVQTVSSTAPQAHDTQADRLRPGEVAKILADPRRLREAMLLSMILQPPPSLRARAHRS